MLGVSFFLVLWNKWEWDFTSLFHQFLW